MPIASPVRLVHLVLGLDVGGLEMVVLDLVRTLDRSRFEPRVLCLRHAGELAPRFEALGVPVEALEARGRVTALAKLVQRLRRSRVDVLHTHNPTPHLLGAIARTLTPIRVLVHTKHGRNYPHLRRAVLANRLASWRTDAVVAVSEDAAHVARRVERIPRDKLRVIHNGVDLTRFLSRPPTDRSVTHAVSVARLHPVKDHATLLRATRKVLEVERNFQLALVGDGPERAAVETLRDELGIGGQVTLHGHRDDIRPSLAAAGLFVLASLSEGISLTLLEAMAAGLPVVATDVGGNREVVAHGETGLLVPPGSPGALAKAILQLVRDPERAEDMGRAGRRRAERMFDLRLTAGRYQQLYADFLTARGFALPAR